MVAVYTWSERTSKITRTVRCQNDEAGSEDLLIPRVSAGTNYTIQVGGANGAGGPLNLVFDYFPDTDGDGILDDAPDKCRTPPGIPRFGGCPPELRSTPRVLYQSVGSGLRITGLAIDDVPKGARAEVRCGRTVKRRATRKGTLKVGGCAGRIVSGGEQIQVRVTLGRTGKGQYRYGAVGKYYRWPVAAGKLGEAADQLPAARLAQAHEVPMRRALGLALVLAALAPAPAGRGRARADGPRLRGPGRSGAASASRDRAARLRRPRRRRVADGDRRGSVAEPAATSARGTCRDVRPVPADAPAAARRWSWRSCASSRRRAATSPAVTVTGSDAQTASWRAVGADPTRWTPIGARVDRGAATIRRVRLTSTTASGSTSTTSASRRRRSPTSTSRTGRRGRCASATRRSRSPATRTG